MKNLKSLALAIIMYAKENDDKLPADLDALGPFLRARDESLKSWLRDVQYLGMGTIASGATEAFTKPIAYYPLASGEGAVAFLDGHVELVKGRDLQALGIERRR